MSNSTNIHDSQPSEGHSSNTESDTTRKTSTDAKKDISILDLAFAMDCTGSMGSYIENARRNIRQIVEEIVSSEGCDVNLALVEYRDHPPQDSSFVTRVNDFTGSVSKMKKWLENCAASGGGDTPEAVADALHDVTKLNWRKDSTKICVFIADAPPHGLSKSGDGFPKGCPAGLDPMKTVRQLAEKGITLYMVGCEPSISPYKPFFSALAHATGGQYVPLSNANLLCQVIVGGAREEISLAQLMSEVQQDVYQEATRSGGVIDEEELSTVLHRKLKTKGVKTQILTKNSAALADASAEEKELSNMHDMSAVRKKFLPAAASIKPRSKMASLFSPAKSKKKMSREASKEMAAAPGSMDYDVSLEAMAEPLDDVYCNIESEISYGQVHRMVKKSVMQQSAKET